MIGTDEFCQQSINGLCDIFEANSIVAIDMTTQTLAAQTINFTSLLNGINPTVFNYLSGATSNLQTQINAITVGGGGTPGLAATIAVGTTTTGTGGTSASVTNSGSSGAAVFNFTIPRGVDGLSSSVNVGTTTTLVAGSSATATNVGTSQNAVINFGIPQGASPVFSIGNVATASPAAATITGTSLAPILNLNIPAGASGAAGGQGAKGDKGDTGDQGAAGAAGDATAANIAAGIAAGAAVTASGAAVAAAASSASSAASAATAISAVTAEEARATTAEGILQVKTQNQTGLAGVTTFTGFVNANTIQLKQTIAPFANHILIEGDNGNFTTLGGSFVGLTTGSVETIRINSEVSQMDMRGGVINVNNSSDVPIINMNGSTGLLKLYNCSASNSRLQFYGSTNGSLVVPDGEIWGEIDDTTGETLRIRATTNYFRDFDSNVDYCKITYNPIVDEGELEIDVIKATVEVVTNNVNAKPPTAPATRSTLNVGTNANTDLYIGEGSATVTVEALTTNIATVGSASIINIGNSNSIINLNGTVNIATTNPFTDTFDLTSWVNQI